MVGPVPPSKARHLEALLLGRPADHLLALAGLAEHGPQSFLACVQGGELVGVLYLGPDGLAVPAAVKGREAARELGTALRTREVRTVVGERRTVGELLAGLRAPRIPARDERLFAATADSMGPYVTPALRVAAEGDLPRLLALTEAYYRERALPPPPEGIEAQVRGRLAAGRIRVLEHEGTVAFRVDIAAESPHGAHLDIIYTAPEFRGRTLASLGLGQLARSMLARIPRITAVAEDGDGAAAVVIRRVGFGPAIPWRRVDLPAAAARAQAG